MSVTDEAGRTAPRTSLVWLLAWISALTLYVATSDRGAQWQDSGWQQLRIVSGELLHPLGLALTHPVQYLLGRVAVNGLPVEPAWAITLVSCLAASIAIANVAAILWMLTRKGSVVLVSASALALAHTFWQQATHTESYAIVAALLTAEWLCLAAYARSERFAYLLLLALFNGVGVATHLLAAIATPIDAILLFSVIRKRPRKGWSALGAAALWLIGTLPYSGLVFATLMKSGDLSGTLHSALFGRFAEQVLNHRLNIRSLALAAGYVVYNYPGLTIPLALHAVFRRVSAPTIFIRPLRYLLLFYALFVVRYSITDQYTFFFPLYLLAALLGGLALSDLLAKGSAFRRSALLTAALITALWTPLVYTTAAKVLESRGLFRTMVGNKPYRNGYQAILIPWGVGQNFATDLNKQAIHLAGPRGLILWEDEMVSFALLYAKATDQAFGDVDIMRLPPTAPAETLQSYRQLLRVYLAMERPVVLVPRDRDRPSNLLPEARWERTGDLYVLEKLSSPATQP